MGQVGGCERGAGAWRAAEDGQRRGGAGGSGRELGEGDAEGAGVRDGGLSADLGRPRTPHRPEVGNPA